MIQDKGIFFADLQGYAAILQWSFYAFLISCAPQIPAFLLVSLVSTIAFMTFLPIWLKSPQKFLHVFRQPWPVWLLFFTAIVVYRGLYYVSLKQAPILEANLLNYLWPLLIVVLGAFFDHKKMAWPSFMGALACFLGVICIGWDKNQGHFAFQWGHIVAIFAAFAWAGYSVATRRFPSAPLDMFGIMFLIAAVLFMMTHIVYEKGGPAQLPWVECVVVVALGVSASVSTSMWNRAMVHGNHHHIAVAAYLTPLLSVVWLIVFGRAVMTPMLWLATFLILGGSTLARITVDQKAEKRS